jgi:hypothetical protein
MVRRGSPVRVRKRAWRKSLQIGLFLFAAQELAALEIGVLEHYWRTQDPPGSDYQLVEPA